MLRIKQVRLFATQSAEITAVRAAGAGPVIAMMLAIPTWLLLLWSTIFPAPWFDVLLAAGHGLVTSTLLASLGGLAVALAIACGLGRLRLRDLGVTRDAVIVGALVTIAGWAIAQIIALAGALIAGDGVALDPSFGGRMGAELVGQVFGNALNEEIAFRGFLLVQLLLLARRRLTSRSAWIVAIVVSQTFFALTHIPQRWVMHDLHGWGLAINLGSTLWFGLQVTLLFVRTGNLMIVVGYHALSNVPLPMFDSPIDTGAVLKALMWALLIAWPYVSARRASAARRGYRSAA